MVRVLCYGHKGYKFKSYIRFIKGYVVKGFTFWLQIKKNWGSIPSYLFKK